MKFLVMLFISMLMLVSCSERRQVVYVDRPAVSNAEPMPETLYSNCYVPGRGYLSDTGRYLPDGYTYRCNGALYRSGVPYRGSLLGAMAIGYYYGSMGPGYGNYGRYHSNVTVVKNVTVYKKGSPGYNKSSGRYKKLQTTRNKNKWVSKSEKKRRVAQSKKAKVANQKKAKSKGFFSRSSNTKSKSYSKPTRTKSKSSSWSRSSSRSSSRRSGGRRRSDERLKNTILPLGNALNKLESIKGVYYYYNDSKERQVGVIAQDVERVLPEIVHVNGDGFRSVSYDLLTPLLIQAIKEQQKQIDVLTKQLKNK